MVEAIDMGTQCHGGSGGLWGLIPSLGFVEEAGLQPVENLTDG